MKKRLYTSIGVVLVIVLAFVLKMLVSNYFFDAFILLISCFAAFELSRLFTKIGKYNYTWVATFFPIFILATNLLGAHFDASLNLTFVLLIDIALILIGFGICFILGMMFPGKTRNEIRIRKLNRSTSPVKYAFDKALNTGISFVYPSFLLMFMTILNHVDELTTTFPNVTKFGGYLSLVALLFMFLIPIFTDTFAYLMGGMIGGKKLAPKISPKKTWAGAIGGLVWCVLLCSCVYLILNSIAPVYSAFATAGFKVWHVILIALFGSIISQFGDLFESLIKRKADVKDSGRLLPGHGGILDRCDSYIFVAPYLLLVFGIILLVL